MIKRAGVSWDNSCKRNRHREVAGTGQKAGVYPAGSRQPTERITGELFSTCASVAQGERRAIVRTEPRGGDVTRDIHPYGLPQIFGPLLTAAGPLPSSKGRSPQQRRTTARGGNRFSKGLATQAWGFAGWIKRGAAARPRSVRLRPRLPRALSVRSRSPCRDSRELETVGVPPRGRRNPARKASRSSGWDHPRKRATRNWPGTRGSQRGMS